MKIRIPSPKPHPMGGPPSGCVPHLPAADCWPERTHEKADRCFPREGLLESLQHLMKGKLAGSGRHQQ